MHNLAIFNFWIKHAPPDLKNLNETKLSIIPHKVQMCTKNHEDRVYGILRNCEQY